MNKQNRAKSILNNLTVPFKDSHVYEDGRFTVTVSDLPSAVRTSTQIKEKVDAEVEVTKCPIAGDYTLMVEPKDVA